MIRRLSAAAAALTVALIVAGGVVTNTDSGLACPDWPTCFGSAMPRMVGNVAVEHAHRLIATAVGLCTVALAVLTLRRARQGALALALAGFSTLILGASFWAGRVKHLSDELPILGVVLVAVGYAGCAWVIVRARASDGKLAAGALWPAGVHPMVHLHMAHRAFAFVVLGLVFWSSLRVARFSGGLIRALAFIAPALVVIQIALGILTIVTFKDLIPVTAHLLVAALLLADYAALLAMTREPASVPLALGVAA